MHGVIYATESSFNITNSAFANNGADQIVQCDFIENRGLMGVVTIGLSLFKITNSTIRHTGHGYMEVHIPLSHKTLRSLLATAT